jgi:E3 ubiquitin-protein ligase SIAH1
MGSLTKNLNEGLLEALACPRCKEYMTPPISFCENGHNVCIVCKPKLNRCHICQQPYLRGTNIALENITRQVAYPCIYQKSGCQDSFPINLITNHQEDCPYGPYRCPIVLAGHTRCPWGGPLAEMKGHFQNNHKDDVWEGTGVCSKKQVMVSPTGLHNNVIMTLGEIFYLQFRGQNDNYYGFVKYIGPKQYAKLYKSVISIVSKDGNEMVAASYITNNFVDENERIITDGKCLKLHYDVVRKLLDEGSMHFKVEILKLEPQLAEHENK